MNPVYTLVALPSQPLLRATLARLVADYARLGTSDRDVEQQAAIVMRVPTAQRPRFHALVREVRDGR
jgi:hypothetical protein